jgi:hypothetical protein
MIICQNTRKCGMSRAAQISHMCRSRNRGRGTYDGILYQTALRTVHRLFAIDEIAAIHMAVFNGWVHSIDRSTGAEAHACILSLQAGRDEFLCLCDS